MKRTKLISILLTLTIAFSLVIIVIIQNDPVRKSRSINYDDQKSLIFSTPMVVVGSFENSNLLNQSTRIEIYNLVKDNPGIHLRGICVELGISVGVAQYHIQLLTSSGLLSSRRYGRWMRYFVSRRFNEVEMKIIHLLRGETSGKILSMLLREQIISHKNLASKLGISSQAVTWHIKRLKRDNIVEYVTENETTRYYLAVEKVEAVMRCHNFISYSTC